MIPTTKDPTALFEWARSADLKQEDQAKLFELLMMADEKIDWIEASARFADHHQIYNEWLALWKYLLGNFDLDLSYPLNIDIRPEVKRPEIQGALF